MAINELSNNSLSSISHTSTPNNKVKTSIPMSLKERLKEQEKKAEEKRKAEKEQKAQEEKKAEENKKAEEEKREKELKEAEEAKKAEKERRKTQQQASEVKNAEGEKKAQESFFKEEKSPYPGEGNDKDEEKNKDRLELSKGVLQMTDLAKRFENIKNKSSIIDKEWASEGDLAYDHLQTTKKIIQQQSSAAIFSHSNLSPQKVVSLHQ